VSPPVSPGFGGSSSIPAPQGQRLHARRKVAAEPTFAPLKALFEMEPAWTYGPANNRALLLLMACCYRLLLHLNRRCRRRVNHVKHPLDVWLGWSHAPA